MLQRSRKSRKPGDNKGCSSGIRGTAKTRTRRWKEKILMSRLKQPHIWIYIQMRWSSLLVSLMILTRKRPKMMQNLHRRVLMKMVLRLRQLQASKRIIIKKNQRLERKELRWDFWMKVRSITRTIWMYSAMVLVWWRSILLKLMDLSIRCRTNAQTCKPYLKVQKHIQNTCVIELN